MLVAAAVLVLIAPNVNGADVAGAAVVDAPKENAGTAKNPDPGPDPVPPDVVGARVVDEAGVEVIAAPNIKGAAVPEVATGALLDVFPAPKVKAGVERGGAVAAVDGTELKAKGAGAILAAVGVGVVPKGNAPNDKGVAAGITTGAVAPNPVNPPNEGVAVETTRGAETGRVAGMEDVPKVTDLLLSSTEPAGKLNPKEEEGAVVVEKGADLSTVVENDEIGVTVAAGTVGAVVAAGAPKEKPVNAPGAAGMTGAVKAVLAPLKENPTLARAASSTALIDFKAMTGADADVGVDMEGVEDKPKLKPPEEDEEEDEEGTGIAFGALKEIAGIGAIGSVPVPVPITAVGIVVVFVVVVVIPVTLDVNPKTVSQDKHFFVPFGFCE